MGRLQTSKLIKARPTDVFAHITDLSYLPEWLAPHFKVVLPANLPALAPQAEIQFGLFRMGFLTEFSARVEEFVPGRSFSYRQTNGFFRAWSHKQILAQHDQFVTLLTEIVEFQMPYGLLGSIVDDVFVRKDMERVLVARLQQIEAHFEANLVGAE